MNQDSEGGQPVTSPEGQAKNTRLSRNDKEPNWLDEDQLAKWKVLPDWRLVFQREKSHLRKTFLFHTIRSNGIAIGISLIIAALIWVIMPGLYFTPSTLISIAGISCVTAASITAIVLAFVVFLFGRAESIEDQSRNNIRREIHKLESLRGEIGNFVNVGVQETVTDPSMIAKVKALADATKKFDAVMYEFIRIFSISSRGTFYDYHDQRMVFLPDHLSARGGAWFGAYSKLFQSFDDRNFARRVWNDATSASSNLLRLNDDIKLAEDQHQKALKVSLALPSFVIIVVLSLIGLLTANTLIVHSGASAFLIISLTITLTLLLTTHIFLLMRWVYQFVCQEMIVRAANRECDRKFSEKNTRVDKEEMIKDSLETTLKYRIDE